jgi:hypothetical protein
MIWHRKGAASPNLYEMITAVEARVYAHATFEIVLLRDKRGRECMACCRNATVDSKRENSVCGRFSALWYSYAKNSWRITFTRCPCTNSRQTCCQGSRILGGGQILCALLHSQPVSILENDSNVIERSRGMLGHGLITPSTLVQNIKSDLIGPEEQPRQRNY